MSRKIYISSLVIVAFFSVQFILPIQLAKAETPDPIKECGIGALTDFAVGGVSKLLDKGLTLLGKGIDSVIPGGIGSFLFGDEEQKVKDAETRTNTQVLTVKNCIQALTDAAFKVALAKLKKRLLDRITDDTIAWINDGAKGKPRFIDNFGDVLKESANEAIGDTVREIGLGNLCDEKLSLKLQLNLRKPETRQFREDASCTLDKIVDNVSAFGQDFRNGGWIGYTETLAPNNNRFGLEILALDNVLFAKTQKEQEVQLSTSVGQGFKGIEACSYWEVIFEEGTDTFSKIKSVNEFSGSDFDLVRDPNTNFTQTQLNSLFGNLAPTAVPVSANCADTQITSPSMVTKGQLDQALQSDKDVVANADDLSPYISAIFDAAINRLIKNGLEGIGIGPGGGGRTSPIFTNSANPQRPQETYGTSTTDEVYKGYGQEYQNATDMKAKLRKNIEDNTKELKDQFVQLDDNLPGYIESIKKIQENLGYLMKCELQKSDNTRVIPVVGTIIKLPCQSTDATITGVNNIYKGAIDFQNMISDLKIKLNTQQDLSGLNETELVTLGSQISNSLEKVKSTRSGLSQAIDELEKINKKTDEYKTECLKPATQTYICPATF